jgi:LmbE family N-acetylglucosaminyl deacetylase
MDNVIDEIIRNKLPCFFISPHLDDAIFSAGDLIAALSGYVPVSVVTLFTRAEDSKPTMSARMFLKQCQIERPEELFAARQREDLGVLSAAGVTPIHLNHSDALWRSNGKTLGKLLPEFGAVYPTYRFHVISGKISRSDNELIKLISGQLANIIPESAVVFSPMGIGNHVDHIITRNICSRLKDLVIYWADFPYDQKSGEDESFISAHKLKKQTFIHNLSRKSDLMAGYVSQVRAMFKDGLMKLQSETYYLPRKILDD